MVNLRQIMKKKPDELTGVEFYLRLTLEIARVQVVVQEAEKEVEKKNELQAEWNKAHEALLNISEILHEHGE